MQICSKIWVIMEMLYDRKSKIIQNIRCKSGCHDRIWKRLKPTKSFLFYIFVLSMNFFRQFSWNCLLIRIFPLIDDAYSEYEFKVEENPNNRFWVNNQDLMIISAYQHIKNIFREESNFHFIKNISRHQPCPDQWEEEHEVKFNKTWQLLTKQLT